LLRLNRYSGAISHHAFSDVCDLLRPSDVLVLNNTEVIPGRLHGYKQTGGRVEILILDYAEANPFQSNAGRHIQRCLIQASKRLKPGSRILLDQGLTAQIVDFEDGLYTVEFSCPGDFQCLLYQIGKVPLPPYIKRNDAPEDNKDKSAYQTVYASRKGAIAAPTAGLHFTRSLLEKLRSKGIKIVELTLHVGYGTFLPVRVTDIREHKMHAERFCLSGSEADVINQARAQGGRIVAVGTTCVRTLEWLADSSGRLAAGSGECDLFIYPGYRFQVVDAMITNFHLPKSTLLMLVAAFAGRAPVLNAYREAIARGYRFYSYGDAMLIDSALSPAAE